MLWPKAKIPKSYKSINQKQWTDWQWQLQNTVKTAEQFEHITFRKIPANTEQLRLTPFLISLINFKNQKDPIGLQHLPQKAEMRTNHISANILAFDKIWETKNDFKNDQNRFLQQKYPDVVALRISNTCQAFCRFCFEKERTLRHAVPTRINQQIWTATLKKIVKKKQIRQVLLTGGDPSILTDQQLKWYLESLLQIPQLKTIRINTRTLLHNPYRITPEFAKMLSDLQKKSWHPDKILPKSGVPVLRGKEIKIGVHFNHPNELTPEAITAIRRLQKAGIQLYNQTVLLKNINNRTSIHFFTAIEEGQKIMEELRQTGEFRGQLPTFEFSHYTGKQIIPTVMTKNFRKKDGVIEFKSDIAGKWEQFVDGK